MGEYIYKLAHSAFPSILTPQFLRSLKSQPQIDDFRASSFRTAASQAMHSTHTAAVENGSGGLASLSTAGLDPQQSVEKIEMEEESPPVHRLRLYQVLAARVWVKGG